MRGKNSIASERRKYDKPLDFIDRLSDIDKRSTAAPELEPDPINILDTHKINWQPTGKADDRSDRIPYITLDTLQYWQMDDRQP